MHFCSAAQRDAYHLRGGGIPSFKSLYGYKKSFLTPLPLKMPQQLKDLALNLKETKKKCI